MSCWAVHIIRNPIQRGNDDRISGALEAQQVLERQTAVVQHDIITLAIFKTGKEQDYFASQYLILTGYALTDTPLTKSPARLE